MTQHPIATFVASAVWALLAAAHAQAQATRAAPALAPLRDQIEKSEDTLLRARALERVTCTSASAAQAGFVAYKKADDAELSALAQWASQTREACAVARREADNAETVAKAAWANLNAALNPSVQPVLVVDFMAAPSALPARPLPTPVSPRETATRTDAPAPAALPLGVAELIERAAKAQDRVDSARAAFADPYESGDAASAAVLKANGLDAEQRRILVEQAQAARASARKVRDSVKAAQYSANELVKSALLLKECDPTPGCANGTLQVKTSEVARRLDGQLREAKTAFEAAKQAGLLAEVGVTYPGADAAKQRANAIAFAKLLDTFPDARSALGEASSFALSAIGSSKVASIKLGGARNLPYGWRQTSFTLSAPLDSSESAQLYTRGTGFDNAASLSASTYWVLGGSRGEMFAGETYLTAAGVKGSAGLGGKHKYRGDDLKKREAERMLREGSVGGYVTLFRQDRDNFGNAEGEPWVHVLSVDARRKAKLGDKSTRCPAPAVGASASLDCVTDYFTAPKFEYSRQFSYEYRMQREKWAFAPKVQYEDVSHLTTVRAPLYLIRSGDPKADKAFNAGIELVWTRGRDEAGKRTTDRALGLFVGVPFSLGEVNRD
jgi:hypothetical protein